MCFVCPRCGEKQRVKPPQGTCPRCGAALISESESEEADRQGEVQPPKRRPS